MYLVEKTFKEIQSIISDTEPPGNRDNVKADMQQVQKYEFQYSEWTKLQIENCISLKEKIDRRTSLYFIDDIQEIYDKFKNNVTKHSNLLQKNDPIPDGDMNNIINNMQIISKYVQPYAEVAAYLGVSPDSSTPKEANEKVLRYMQDADIFKWHAMPTEANEKVLQYKTDANIGDITALKSQWHAIGRLTDILMRMKGG
jgi:hypothetical protein